jgi:hypothetical protein
MDLLTCSIDYFALTADTISERLHAPAPEKLNNTLALEYAGYFDRAIMMNIEKNGGFVIGQAACTINPVIKSAYGYEGHQISMWEGQKLKSLILKNKNKNKNKKQKH